MGAFVPRFIRLILAGSSIIVFALRWCEQRDANEPLSTNTCIFFLRRKGLVIVAPPARSATTRPPPAAARPAAAVKRLFHGTMLGRG